MFMARKTQSISAFKKSLLAVFLGLALVIAVPASAQADSRMIRIYEDQGWCMFGGSTYVLTGGATTYRCVPFYSAGQGGWALVVYY
jgi:hypothetical protein